MSSDRYCACPYCESIFRLPEAKFKHKGGIVRCGSCREIFDANGNLVIREQGRFIPVSTVSAPITRHPGENFTPEQGQVSGKDHDGHSTAEQSLNRAQERSPNEPAEETSQGASLNMPDREQADPGSVSASDPTSQKSNLESGLLQSEERLRKELDAAENFLAKIDPGESRSSPEPDEAIDKVRNPFRDDLSGNTRETNAPEQRKRRNEPSFGPLNLDQDSEEESDDDAFHNESSSWSQRTEIRSVLFADTEDPVDQVDDDVDIKLVTAGVSENNISSHSLNPASELSGMDDTPLGRMSRNGVDDYINRRRRPFATISWMLVSLGFLALLGLQVKHYFVQDYAQDETWRPYLAAFCKVAGCNLPLREDPFRFTLTHTKIDLHPVEPGAIRITVKMINEARFDQPYPGLQLTLTDRVGRVVGRRTFTPDRYLTAQTRNLVGRGELVSVRFDLARPHEKAVGFVVDVIKNPA